MKKIKKKRFFIFVVIASILLEVGDGLTTYYASGSQLLYEANPLVKYFGLDWSGLLLIFFSFWLLYISMYAYHLFFYSEADYSRCNEIHKPSFLIFIKCYFTNCQPVKSINQSIKVSLLALFNYLSYHMIWYSMAGKLYVTIENLMLGFMYNNSTIQFLVNKTEISLNSNWLWKTKLGDFILWYYLQGESFNLLIEKFFMTSIAFLLLSVFTFSEYNRFKLSQIH